MANSIELAEKFMPILDGIYKTASKTARMDSPTLPFDGADTVKVFKTNVVGLGAYSRTTGYPVGDVTGVWEALQLTQSRGREFNIDRMDNEETLGMAFGKLAGEFVRTQVVPEVDAYRFAKYANDANIQKVGAGATLDSSTVVAAIDAAIAALNAEEVPEDGRILYISDSVKGFLESAINRTLSNENAADKRLNYYNGMEVVMVPQKRFYTAITLDPGATANAGGYAKTAATGADINFMIIYPESVLQATKLANLKIFDPQTNQGMDAWKFQYRLYHDAFVYQNKAKGIYLHMKAVEG